MNNNMIKWVMPGLFLTCPALADAQFNTIRKQSFIGYETLSKKDIVVSSVEIQEIDSIRTQTFRIDSLAGAKEVNPVFCKNETVRKKHLGFTENHHAADRRIPANRLPELTIPNLMAEIRKNGLRHEKIVLAQAILETGWFRSSVCRNKNNLFGLTNPRTGQYYEFNHWTESVRAYYTKVQYRFKGGNYLMWLDRIGYAEDPRYVSSLIKILRQYML